MQIPSTTVKKVKNAFAGKRSRLFLRDRSAEPEGRLPTGAGGTLGNTGENESFGNDEKTDGGFKGGGLN